MKKRGVKKAPSSGRTKQALVLGAVILVLIGFFTYFSQEPSYTGLVTEPVDGPFTYSGPTLITLNTPAHVDLSHYFEEDLTYLITENNDITASLDQDTLYIEPPQENTILTLIASDGADITRVYLNISSDFAQTPLATPSERVILAARNKNGDVHGITTRKDQEGGKFEANITVPRTSPTPSWLALHDVVAMSEQLDVYIDSTVDAEVQTDVVYIDSVDVSSAEAALNVYGDVTHIVKCEDFDKEVFICNGNWMNTDIPFVVEGDVVRFTVDNFSAYGGGEGEDEEQGGGFGTQGGGFELQAEVVACDTTINEDSFLTGNLNANEKCIIFGADDIELDCRGNTITYANADNTGVSGIIASDRNNITIRSCNIIDGSSGGGSDQAILFNNTHNSFIVNSTIQTNGSSSLQPIFLIRGSENNTIANNTITVKATGGGAFLTAAIKINNSHRNTIANNTIRSQNPNSAHGIQLDDAFGTTIFNNNIQTNSTAGGGARGIASQNTANGSLIANNTINTLGTSTFDDGITLSGSHFNNVILGNTITTIGNGETRGLFFNDGAFNLIQENYINNTQGGANSHIGIAIENTNNSNFTGNTIFASGNSGNIGFEIDAGGALTIGNRFTNNFVSTNGTGAGNDGVSTNGDVFNHTFTSNTFTIVGSTSDAVELNTDADDNKFFNNNFTVQSIGFPIVFSSAENNLFSGNSLQAIGTNWMTSNVANNNFTNTTYVTENGSIQLFGTLTYPAIVLTKNLLDIKNNSAHIDTDTQQVFNLSGRVTLRNITVTNPGPIVDFEDDGTFIECNPPQCVEESFANNVFVFNVSSFTNYSSNESGANCGDISTNTSLSQDVLSDDTCFTISANDLTLDCKGFTIRYNADGGDNEFGISVIGRRNVVIKNCIILDVNETSDNTNGIRFNGVNNSFILNNTIITNASDTSFGINLVSNDRNNLIANNTILASGVNFTNIGISLANSGINNTITRNNITTNGSNAPSSDTNDGIRLLTGSSFNTITRNIINATNGNAIELSRVNGTNLFNNTYISNQRPIRWTSGANNTASVNDTFLDPADSNAENSGYTIASDDSVGNNLTNFTVSIAPLGYVRFLETFNHPADSGLTETTINPSFNSIFVRTNGAGSVAGLNQTARIVLGNITQFSNPRPLVDLEDDQTFIDCAFPQCFDVSFDGTDLALTVRSFSNYTAGEAGNLSINFSLIVGAIEDDDGGEDRGAVYVLQLNKNGTPLGLQKISNGQGGLPNGTFGLNDSKFGRAVTSLGDIDGDDVRDIAVSYVDFQGTNSTTVFVFLMHQNGTVKNFTAFNETDVGANEDSLFGEGIAGIGDLNSDGVPDLAVGAVFDQENHTGSVFILLLQNNGSIGSFFEINDSTLGPNSIAQFDNFGRSVADIADLNGDGIRDLVVGAPADDDGGANAGAIYIIFMNTTGIKGFQKISDTAGGFTPSLDAADVFGRSVAGLSDVDGDGIPDIAVGASQDDDGGLDTGAVYTILLNTDGTVKSTTKINKTLMNEAINNSDFFGLSVAGLGDLDGDGVPDMAVGAPDDDDGQGGAGAVYIIFLNTSGGVKNFGKINDSNINASGPTLDISDSFGFSVAFTNHTPENANVIRAANISLVKTGNNTITAGQNITFTINVTNTGNFTAVNVTVGDILPRNTTFVSSQPPANDTNLTFLLGNLSAGQSVLINITATVNASVANNTNLTNIANATFFNTSGTLFFAENSTFNFTVVGLGQANVVLTKVANVTHIRFGDHVLFTINVTNNGNATAFNVTVTDILPNQTGFVRAVPAANDTNFTFLLGDITVGATVQINLTVNQTGILSNNKNITNTVNGTFIDTAAGLQLTNNASVNVTSNATECGNLLADLTLINDVIDDDTCFTILANGVTIDCDGFSIKFNRNGGSNEEGIDASGRSNILIQNCDIQDINDTGNNNAGILFDTTTNSRIVNNLVQGNGTNNNDAVRLIDGSNGNLLENNTLRLKTNGAVTTNEVIEIENSVRNEIRNNNITTNGTGSERGIDVESARQTNITNNIIVMNSSGGVTAAIGLTGSTNDSLVLNNTIITDGVGAQHSGIIIAAGFNRNNALQFNTIRTNGTSSNIGIQFSRGSNLNIITNNTIIANGSGAGNIGFSHQASFGNNFSGNTIFTDGTTLNRGVRIIGFTVTSSNNTVIANNEIRTAGTSDNEGINLGNRAVNNTFLSNIIFTSASNSAAISISGGNGLNNTFIDNILNVTDPTSFGVELDDAGNNTFNRTTFLNTTNWIDTEPGSFNFFFNSTFVSSDARITLFAHNVSGNNDTNRSTLDIGINGAFINTDLVQYLNASGQVQINNLNVDNPQAFVDFEDDGTFIACNPPQCVPVAFAGNSFTFNVSSFTNYTVQELVNVTVVKFANQTNVTTGDLIEFTINVSNFGNETAFNVTVVDILPNGTTFLNASPGPNVSNTTFFFATINANDSEEINITVNVTGNFTQNVIITNTVNLTFFNQNNSRFIGDNATVNIQFNAQAGTPNITLIKNASKTTANQGTIANFTILVNNTGDASAVNVTVSDVLPAGAIFVNSTPPANDTNLTFLFSNIGVGATTTIVITFNVSTNISNGTVLENFANATFRNSTGTLFFSNNATANITATTIVIPPNITLNKTANDLFPDTGDTVIYTINVTNIGGSTALNVTVGDILPPNVTLVSTSPAANDTNVTFILGNIAPNTSVLLNVTVTVDNGLANGTQLENTVNATFFNESALFFAQNVSLNVTVNVTPTQPNLSLTKTVNATTASPGDTIKFFINVTNTGETIAFNVTVTDILPQELIFDSASPAPVAGTNTTFFFANISANTTAFINITANVTSNVTNGTIIINVVNATFLNGTQDINIAVNTTVNITLIVPPADAQLVVTKNASINPAVNGSNVTFTINVTNIGQGDAFNVTVVDILPGNVTFVAASPTPVPGTNTTFLFNLSAGQTQIIQINITLNNTFVNATNLLNFVNVTFFNATNDTKNVQANQTTLVVNNTPPVCAAPIGNAITDQGNDINVHAVLTNAFTDADGDTLTFEDFNDPNNIVAIEGDNLAIRVGGFTGQQENVIVRASDNFATVACPAFSVTVNAVGGGGGGGSGGGGSGPDPDELLDDDDIDELFEQVPEVQPVDTEGPPQEQEPAPIEEAAPTGILEEPPKPFVETVQATLARSSIVAAISISLLLLLLLLILVKTAQYLNEKRKSPEARFKRIDTDIDTTKRAILEDFAALHPVRRKRKRKRAAPTEYKDINKLDKDIAEEKSALAAFFGKKKKKTKKRKKRAATKKTVKKRKQATPKKKAATKKTRKKRKR